MRKIPTATSIALLLLSGGAISAYGRSRAQEILLRTYRNEPMASAQLGVLALRMNGDTVACVNARRKFVPASNMKLISTGLALLCLGPDYRFETGLGYSGEISEGTLHGDLYIVGGGDPTTGMSGNGTGSTAELFSLWESQIRAAGIQRIDGRIVGDPRFLNPQTAECSGWTYDDLGSRDGAGPRGLNFFENRQNFYITPGAVEGSAPFVHPRYPDTPWMDYSVSAVTSGPGSGNTLIYVNSDFSHHGEIRGHFPIDRKGYTLECTNRFGALTCAFYLFRYLHSHGIPAEGYADVSHLGELREYPDRMRSNAKAVPTGELTMIGGSLSSPLRELVAHANKESDNFYAETFLRMIGKSKGRSVEYEDCIEACEKELAAMGTRTGQRCTIFDGSGLSRKNYVAPSFFVDFLKAMRRSPVFDAYLASLPAPGEKRGTLEFRFGKSPDSVRARIRCKTGSMNGVRCYSGYILSSDGKPEHDIVFSVLSNNNSGHLSYVSTILEEIITAIAEEN